MPYEIKYLENEKIIMMKNVGKMTYDDFVEEAKKAIELSNSKNTNQLFVDDTLLEPEVDALEIYDFPKMYDELNAPKNNCLAVLMKKDSPDAENFRFYENVCRNQGWCVKVFTDHDTAMAWLKE